MGNLAASPDSPPAAPPHESADPVTAALAQLLVEASAAGYGATVIPPHRAGCDPAPIVIPPHRVGRDPSAVLGRLRAHAAAEGWEVTDATAGFREGHHWVRYTPQADRQVVFLARCPATSSLFAEQDAFALRVPGTGPPPFVGMLIRRPAHRLLVSDVETFSIDAFRAFVAAAELR